MMCNVCYDRGTYGGCWKCGKIRDRILNGNNLSCRSCGWEMERDGGTPIEKTIGYYTQHLCPKCGRECTPFSIY